MIRSIGVCSWSLHPCDPDELIQKMRAVGVNTVQLALDPLRTGQWPQARECLERLHNEGIEIASGMMAMHGEDYSTLDSIRATGGVRLDANWQQNLAAAQANAEIAAVLGVDLVTFHAGFIPQDPGDPHFQTMIDRVRTVVNVFAGQGVRVALETGQETADTLLDALDKIDRPQWLGVNFDPANMILYGMGDPVAALRELAPRLWQIHIKDALPAAKPGAWGAEVPVGAGAVQWEPLLEILASVNWSVDAMLEREAGDDRITDLKCAVDQVQSLT